MKVDVSGGAPVARLVPEILTKPDPRTLVKRHPLCCKIKNLKKALLSAVKRPRRTHGHRTQICPQPSNFMNHQYLADNGS